MPSEEDAKPPVRSGDPTLGSRTALVTIVEFADFQCPFCARAEATLRQIGHTYKAGEVRLVWKHNPLPFHQNARPAAEAAAGVYALAGNDAFWRFHDAALTGQQPLGRESYLAWAKDAGVHDVAALAAGLDDHTWAAKIDGDLADGKANGVTGTPAFLINGIYLSGAQPFDAFKSVIDDQLAKARAKLAAGTLEGRLYAELSKENAAAEAARPKAAEEEPDANVVFKIPIGNAPARGGQAALVTIVEFSDFQCPYCKRVDSTLKALRDKYQGKLRIVWRNEPLPFHGAAEPAAQAALEVRVQKGDAAFWQVHDGFFANQKDLMSGATPNIDRVVELAAASGVRPDRIRSAITNHAHQKAIDEDEDIAEDFQANGTPHFFINGRRLVGAQPQDKFEQVIDEEIAKAEGLVAKGTAPAAVYAELTKDGKGPPEPEKRAVPNSVPRGDPSRGKAGARVVVHEWADFQCPYCARATATMTELVKDYGDRVAFAWHDLPLPMHPDAPLAAEAGREAYAQQGARGFWALHDKLFANPQNLKRDDLDGFARDLGLDMTKWTAALDGMTHAEEVEADEKAAGEVAFQGTPSFLIVRAGAHDGYVLVGAQAYRRFRRLIERTLKEAR
jgi:protein-disulfide isomerase